jgi:hypothetical protein
MACSLQHALDEALGFIEQALEHIRAGEGSELELQNLRAYLVGFRRAMLLTRHGSDCSIGLRPRRKSRPLRRPSAAPQRAAKGAKLLQRAK